MTFPITPNPAIHDGRAGNTSLTDPTALVQNVTSLFQEIPQIIINGAIQFIKQETGIDLTGVEQFFDSFITAIENGGTDAIAFVQSILKPLTDALASVLGAPIPQLDTIVDSLAAFLGNTNILATAANELAGIANAAAQAASGLATAAQGAITDVQNFVNAVVQAIITAISGLPFVGNILTGGLSALQTTVAAQQGNQQAAVVTVATGNLGANESWKAPYPVADVSYPRIFHSAMQIQGITLTASTGTAHTHDMFGLNGVTGGNLSIVPLNILPQGAKRGSFVTTRVATVYDTVAIYAGGPTGLNNVFIEVYRKDSLGNITMVTSQEVSAQLVTPGVQTPYHEFFLPSPIIANVGESYAVVIRNSSTNNVQFVIRTMYQEDLGPVLFTGTDTLKTSYTAAEVSAAQLANGTFATGTEELYPLPFAMLATAQPVPGEFTYTDNFDNRSSFGPLWLPTQDTILKMKLSGNRAVFNGTVAGSQLNLYTLPVGTDGMMAEANLYSRAISSSTCGVMLYCNRELTQTVYLGVEQALIHLYAGPWNALTQVGLWATGAADAKFSVVGDPSTGIFTILRDGTDVQSWNSAGTVKFGEQFRYGGIRATKSPLVGTSGPGEMDNFTFRDFTA